MPFPIDTPFLLGQAAIVSTELFLSTASFSDSAISVEQGNSMIASCDSCLPGQLEQSLLPGSG